MTILSQEKLASLVKQKRENLGLTQEVLGAQTGISKLLVAKIESGSSLPSNLQLESLIETLGLSLEQLCIGKEPRDIEDIYRRCNIETPEAKEQLYTILHMMMTIRQQVILHELYKNEAHC